MATDDRDDKDDKDERERKEKVLHARISETLDQELRTKAASLGLSVSNLVRNILLNTFGLVEDVLSDSANIARSARGEPEPQSRGSHADARLASHARPRERAEPGAASAPSPIVGWQESLLAVNAVCDQCNKLLPKGTKGAIAVREMPGPRTVLCSKCLKEALRDAHDTDDG